MLYLDSEKESHTSNQAIPSLTNWTKEFEGDTRNAVPVVHDKNCVWNFPFSEYVRTTNICGIVIITLLSDLFVGRYSNFKISASK
jgi:hypothetical protein